MTRMCLSLTGKTLSENLAIIEESRQWIDIVELRADFLNTDEFNHIGSFPRNAGLPAILTIRLPKDGGHWHGTEQRRGELFAAGIAGGFAYVDLEGELPLTTLRSMAAKASIRIISSLHDLDGMPANLTEVLERLKQSPQDIPKIACTPCGVADLFNLFDAARDYSQSDFILLGMGSYGFPTRVLAPKFGAFLTFASAAGASAAPGHISPKEMMETYRFREVQEDWELFGIIANPVAHSKSPHIHNPALSATGTKALYVPFRVDDVPEFFSRRGSADIKGISVTIPHKETVIAHLDNADTFVEAIGSCNTVVWYEGGVEGLNTDAPGFLSDIQPLVSGRSFHDLRASVVGAGGTARAICAALISVGCKPVVFNRSAKRAEKLAGDFGLEWHTLNPSSIEYLRQNNDLIVQTTSAGMAPLTDVDPLSFYQFTGKELVYDVIYAPEETLLLRRARTAGCKGLNGWGMLLEQAYLQFRAFTGKEYPKSLTQDLI